MISPYRNAISHAPRRHKPTPDDPCLAPGSRGRPHSDAKVSQVRRLIETTTYSYVEIAKRTGVPSTTISRWMTTTKWPRPLFAPRSTDTVPRWRASLRLRRRTLSNRLYALAERWVRELEASPGVDFAKLREGLELLKLTRLAERRHNPRRRPIAAADPLAHRAARERVIADLRANGVDIARAPSEALADHKRFSMETDIDVYFCDPQSPWQRGSSENTNRLLRQYFPKGLDLAAHSQAELNKVARQLNERPRKTLDFQSPTERFSQCVAATG